MDPVEDFPAEVFEMIMSQLTGKDLVHCLLVSRDWNSVIRSSLTAMKKLKLVLTSDCKCSALRCEGISIMNEKWKSIQIVDVNFPSPSDVSNILEKVESTVEHLELVDVYVGNREGQRSIFNFKHLKSLKFWFCDARLCYDLINQNLLVESLDLGYSGRNVDKSGIIQILKQLPRLKQLNLASEFFYDFLNTNFDDFPFHLEKFSLTKTNLDFMECHLSKTEKLLMFLKTQANSLKELHIGVKFEVEVLQFALKMKSLKKLRIASIPFAFIDWQLNTSIEVLDVVESYLPDGYLKPLLEKVPNLKELRMKHFASGSLASFIAINLKQIQKISFNKCDLTFNDEQLLPNVEFSFVNKNLYK